MQTKPCIACAEEIQQAAKLCKFCGIRQNDPDYLDETALVSDEPLGVPPGSGVEVAKRPSLNSNNAELTDFEDPGAELAKKTAAESTAVKPTRTRVIIRAVSALVLISIVFLVALVITGSSFKVTIRDESAFGSQSAFTTFEVVGRYDTAFKIVYLEGVDEYCPQYLTKVSSLHNDLVVSLPRVDDKLFRVRCYRIPSGTSFTVVGDDGESTSSQAFVISAGRKLVKGVASTSRNQAPAETAASAEPFGGQCGLIAPAALVSTLAMTGLGSQNFDIDSDAAKEFVVNSGYRSFKEWIEDVENLFGFLGILDKDILTQQELAITDSLAGALVPGEMTLALARSDSDWFENTYSNLISLGVACDGV